MTNKIVEEPLAGALKLGRRETRNQSVFFINSM